LVAPTKNHPSDHTVEANAKPAKGHSMASMYDIEKQLESINQQIAVMCAMLGIDPTPAPNDEAPTIEELTDPDA
jgi:hypothetical protein